MVTRYAALAACLLLLSSPAISKGGGTYGSYSSGSHGHSASAKRDASGKIARSPQAKHDFQKSHPCPATRGTSGSCPGYVVDHVVPLKRGGADAPSNMQWQTIEQAKQKDKVE